MTSYIVWEHPCLAVFDIDDFCQALSGEASELASKLLVMSVLAFALVCESDRQSSWWD